MLSHLTEALCLVLLAPQAISATPIILGRDDTAGASTANATQVLLPAAHPDVDTSDPALLKPSKSTFMFFSDDGGSSASDPHRLRRRADGSTVASLSVNSPAYSSVNLLHADSVNGLTCGNRSVTVPFDNEAAFKVAASTWPSSNKFVLINYEEGCGPGASNDEHSYLLVEGCRAAPTGRTLTCSVTYIPFETFVGQGIITIDLGSQNPPPVVHRRSSSLGLLNPLAKRFDKSKTFTFSEKPTNADSQWGPAYEIFSSDSLHMYCVDCGASGAITITGTITVSVFSGLKSASIRATGDLRGGLKIGAVATDLSPSITISDKQLIYVPLAGFDIPGIVAIGPSLELKAGGSAGIKAQGDLLAGVTLDWPQIDVTADLLDHHSSHASGLSPNVNPVFTTDGSFIAEIDAHLGVRLGVGVNILKGKYDKSIALVEQPGVSIQAGSVGSCGSGGVGATLKDDFFIDFLGLEQFSLFSWSSNQYTKCF